MMRSISDLRIDELAWEKPATGDYHLRCVESALEDALNCIAGDTPEDCTHEEATRETLDLVRAALLDHLPEVRRALYGRKG